MSVKPHLQIALIAGLLCLLGLAATPALGAESGPQWTITAISRPTNFGPGDQSGQDSYLVALTNTGGAATDGSPIVITDELPAGLSLDPAGASGKAQEAGGLRLTCIASTCTYSHAMPVDETLLISFPVDVDAGAPGSLTNVVHVTGGGAAGASAQTPTEISAEPAKFGISPGGASTTLSSVQAGAHADLTSSIAFNTVNTIGSLAGEPKNIVYNLPAGFAGDLIDTPTCPAGSFREGKCKSTTQVGVVSDNILLAIGIGRSSSPTGGFNPIDEVQPVFNLAPNPGEVAKLGFEVGGEGGAYVEGGVYLRGDYGLETVFEDAPQNLAELNRISLTLWGVPADPVHDHLRFEGVNAASTLNNPSQSALAPFFTNPTLCGTEPLQAGFAVNSWQEPDAVPVRASMRFGPIVGCDRLQMEPSLSVEATSSKASSPSGLDLGMNIHQTYDNALGLATSTLKRAVVTLPEGMTVNPSAGAGLGACSEAQYAQEGAQFVEGQGCPQDSKLGEVSIVTPAIQEAISGSVYLATPAPNGEAGRNPFDSLLALYIVARLPERGIVVKTAGQVQADPATGQLVTTFEDLPPLPFSEFTFRFHSGATAPLVTPPLCGDYEAQAELSPYSTPAQVLTPAIPAFPITSGFDGGACPTGGVDPFSPALSAGTLNNSAASFSPLDIDIVRNDGEQEITGFASQLPPGLTANLTGVPFCSEAAIAAARTKTGGQEELEPSCPADSEIGHTIVEAGVGSVLVQAPGKIYMAGPFEGAPFSVVAITAAKVGPFDLGTVVVHLPLRLNSTTAQVSIPAGPSDQIPHIIKGIVVHVRNIHVYVDKPSFALNPTSCARQTFAMTVIGAGANAANPADDVAASVADPFQAANCANLKFAPKFAVSTSGKTSRARGASLNVKLTYPQGALGADANIARVKVELPKQLPSQLKTLQKACTAAQFEANPAGCPAASMVGHAKAVTPLIPVPLEGPAIFVSHGNESFPTLTIVLQGYGVTIDLVGSTFISKTGITSSTFKTVPDQPIGSFELTLPQGPYSALAANGNLCRSKLTMPTEFLAQNGAKINRMTKIAVTGCPKAKRAKKHHARKREKAKRRRIH